MNCLTCSAEMSEDPADPRLNCGGDCATCMAEAGDPAFSHLLPRDEHGNECESLCANCGVPCVDTWCNKCYDGNEEEEE